MSVLVSALARLRYEQRGYSLIETLSVLGILGTVMGSLTAVFVSAMGAEVDMNKRFQAQQTARVALDRLRRETHCSNSITPAGPATAVTLSFPPNLSAGSFCGRLSGTQVTWCAVSVSATRYRLFRSTANPCGDAPDSLYADYLTSQTLFEHTLQSSASLGKLKVDLPVDIDPAKTGSYRLVDTLVMRNTKRTCITGSPSPPC